MAQLVITAAATAIGAYFGGPQGAKLGFTAGAHLGDRYAAGRRQNRSPVLGPQLAALEPPADISPSTSLSPDTPASARSGSA